MPRPSPTPALDAMLRADPDLVDRIFEYLVTEIPSFGEAVHAARVAELKLAVRSEFAGDRQRIGPRTDAGRRDLATQVLAIFNGRNASEVARRLNIGRATVYRVVKQAGPSRESSLILGRAETDAAVGSGSQTNPPPFD